MRYGYHLAILAIAVFSATSADNTRILQAFLDATPIHPQVRIVEPDYLPYPTGSISRNRDFNGRFKPYEGCSLNVTGLKVGDYGNITSPKYPMDYPPSTECLWTIESEPGTKIDATFFDFITQPWFFVYFDKVDVSRDGTFTKVDTLAGDLNERTPFNVQSEANKMSIRFESSQFSNYRGFKLEYVVKPEENFEVPSVYDGICGESYTLDPNWVPTTPAPTTEANTESYVSTDATTESYVPAEATTSEATRIIGDNPTQPHEYPWMVALLINGKSFCGGSIIDKRHILTAAHCTDGAENITILMGSHSIKQKEESRKIVNITAENIFQHPNYDEETIFSDISILRLPEELEYNENIKPVCLPNRFMMTQANVGDTVRVSGWGIQSDDAKTISPTLQHTQPTTIMTNANCRQLFRDLITGNQVCMNTTPRNSACKGDSGGPLFTVVKANNGTRAHIVQYGIVSFGSFSCERGFPVAFTRVTAFLDYIEEITGRKF